ncbi:MAG TPA: TolC family protein [Gemmatimonadaceae bacterium]|nr:TolC family protein [Gemmatimonadaceae bacterium]
MPRHPSIRTVALATAAAALAACAGTPNVNGVAGTSPSPSTAWTPPARHDSAAARPTPPAALPPDLQQRVRELTLGDIVDIALRNNPATQISWENARAAASAYGSAKGQYYPTIDLGVNANRVRSTTGSGSTAVVTEQYTGGPNVTVNWLLFDLGGRSGSISAAREALVAADWSHNRVLQDVVLEVQTAYFNYVANRALREAQLLTLREAQTNLDVTNERHTQGLATIADVLQAKTQLSQAELALETTEGAIQTTRGALASAMGLPANLPYDIAAFPPLQVGVVTDSVDTLIARAVRARPDLAASEADAQAAAARVTQARGAYLPSLSLFGTGGPSYINTLVGPNTNYTATLALKIPLFAGFSREYNKNEAQALARAAAAQSAGLRQLVVLQVFTSYYALQTAARRVRTADDLLASATQSEQVALGRYKAGVGSILDLLTAQSALADARAQAIETRWVWRTALSQLAHDIGILDVHGDSPLRITADSTATPR